MGVENTIIRGGKGDSGLIGLTRKQSALVRWTLTRYVIGEYASAMRERSGQKETELDHKQAQPAAMKRDEADVQTLVKHIEENMTNPFEVQDHEEGVLINIATGIHATKEVQKSLLSSVDKGQERI